MPKSSSRSLAKVSKLSLAPEQTRRVIRRPRRMPQSRVPLRRIYSIHDRLRRHKFPNCQKLAAEFEVSYKTIQRDIDFMRDQLHLPIEYDADLHGFFYTHPVHEMPNVLVSEGELVALLVAERALQQYQGTVFEAPLRSAFGKMQVALQGEQKVDLEAIASHISFQAIGASVSDLKLYEKLASAVLNGVEIEFLYQALAKEQAQARAVQPYQLHCVGNQWYLVAFDLVRQELRSFALPRMSKLKSTRRRFIRPEGFDITTLYQHSLGAFRGTTPQKVVLKLDELGTRLLGERRWHPTQEISQKEGVSILSMEVAVNRELENWVMSWGEHVRVIEPKTLQQRIQTRLQATLDSYQEPLVKRRGRPPKKIS
ncbi:MAG: helix-turn-helix transcriptional regulator [Verrucomicrobiales bacterium]